jgi:hypothetical protein
MNFGGTNIPHTFQTVMQEPVRELRRELGKLGGSVVVYLDDILIMLPSLRYRRVRSSSRS